MKCRGRPEKNARAEKKRRRFGDVMFERLKFLVEQNDVTFEQGDVKFERKKYKSLNLDVTLLKRDIILLNCSTRLLTKTR
jgi:hypothetical protein